MGNRAQLLHCEARGAVARCAWCTLGAVMVGHGQAVQSPVVPPKNAVNGDAAAKSVDLAALGGAGCMVNVCPARDAARLVSQRSGSCPGEGGCASSSTPYSSIETHSREKVEAQFKRKDKT
jgi:hypothetical protein